MKEEFWFDSIFDECHNISDIAYELKGLAKAFHRTGNEAIHNELLDISDQLLASDKIIQSQVGGHCNEDFKKSEEASKNMVLAALSVAGMK